MSKGTSLSEQLKRLQVPQTSVLNVVGDRRRVSFLYDPKEAANMDSEAVYCLAMNGLEQLKSIDFDTFDSFEQTLFSSNSIQFERAIQTKQVNEKINSELRRFLVHLSPYFMLKPAHKVFEWLVYRYQIYNYNLNDMFMCILPYHETNYFVRALQMINFSVSHTSNEQHKLWHWLIDNQSKGVVLASSTLATHCYSDLSFFNFLINYLNECLVQFIGEQDDVSTHQQKHWSNSLNFAFSFLTKTLLQSIKQLSIAESATTTSGRKNSTSKQQESFLAQLMPILYNGFKSDIIVYKQSAYLICSFLFEKFKFNSKTINKTLFALAKGLSTFRIEKMDADNNENDDDDDEADNDNDKRGLENDDKSKSTNDFESILSEESIECVKSAILTICLIVQSQYNKSTSTNSNSNNNNNNNNDVESLMNKNILKKLIKNFSKPSNQIDLLVDTIDSLNESYKIEKFLKCLFERLVVDLIEYDKCNENAFNSISVDLDMNNDENELKSKANNQYADLLLKLINKLNLSRTPNLIQSLIDTLFNSLIQQDNIVSSFTSLESDSNNNNNNNHNRSKQTNSSHNLPNLLVEYHLCELISKCEHKYPSQFDTCLNTLLSQTSQSTLPSSISDSNKSLNDQQQRTYFLNTISCKFVSFKCKSAFKYQQIKNETTSSRSSSGSGSSSESTELNLLLSLNHSNANIRANALDYMLNEIKKLNDTKLDDIKRVSLDEDFIREQIESKFRTESSPLVIQHLIQYDLKLLDYIRLESLIDNEIYLLKIFNQEIISNEIDLNDTSGEMNEFILNENRQWSKPRQQAIEFIFTNLYKINLDKCEMFFNTFLILTSKLFELKSLSLINVLKKTQFYADLQRETRQSDSSSTTNADESNSIATQSMRNLSGSITTPPKKFYSSSSITLTKLSTGVSLTTRLINGNGHENNNNNSDANMESDSEDTDLLNEQFENFLQISVKYLLSNSNKKNNFVKVPKCFSQFLSDEDQTVSSKKVKLIDLVAFELSIRLCAQSLFLLNASYFLNLSANFLYTLFSKPNLKLKKSTTIDKIRDESLNLVNGGYSGGNGVESLKKINNLNNYNKLVRKQSIRNPDLVAYLYQSLFKSVNIQTSNFVNTNSKYEIELLLNRLFVHLCCVCESNKRFNYILERFMRSTSFNCLTSACSPMQTPTKISIPSNTGISNSFLQFAFKFLIYLDKPIDTAGNNHQHHQQQQQQIVDKALVTQLITIQLFGAQINDLIFNFKKVNEGSMLNALVLTLTWCLTSKHESIRVESLNLLEKINLVHTTNTSGIESDSDVAISVVAAAAATTAANEKEFIWLSYIKKLLKHRQEIEIDGGDYIRKRLLNKLIQNNPTQSNLVNIISQFLNATTSSKHQLIQPHLQQRSPTFFSNYYNQSNATYVLYKLKYSLIDLFKYLKDELKLKLLDSIMNLFLNLMNSELNETTNENDDNNNDDDDDETVGGNDGYKLLNLFERLVELIVNNYLITSKSSQYFADNEKHFDYIIGYLNKSIVDLDDGDDQIKAPKTPKLIKLFVESFIIKLAEFKNTETTENEEKTSRKYFNQLPIRMQMDLLRCCFDMWLSNSSYLLVANSPTHVFNFVESIRKCLLSFNLNTEHYLCLFNERVNLTLANNKDSNGKDQTPLVINTTKQMKKQLKQVNLTSLTKINWKCLKLVLELIQSELSVDDVDVNDDADDETKMNVDQSGLKNEKINGEKFIDLIPYLFLVLDTIEATLSLSTKKLLVKKDSNEMSIELLSVDPTQQKYLTNEDNSLKYLQIMALNCLTLIYKSNIQTNKLKLNQVHFDIELLMQILQTKRDVVGVEETVEESNEDKSKDDQEQVEIELDNLNVQEHVLLLLSEVAAVFPDKVLEHVLIMFVFVGNKLARKDDSYSFQIISKLIKVILPSIVNSINNESGEQAVSTTASHEQTNKLNDAAPTTSSTDGRLKKTVNIVQRHQKQLPYVSSLVCKILQSFVVALPHIPAHRKTIIFNQLLQIIGLDEYLWITIIQSIDYYLVQSHDLLDFTNSLAELQSKQQQQLDMANKNKRHLRDTLKTCIQSMISLHIQFEPTKIIQTNIYLVVFLNKYLNSLFDTAFKLLTSSSSSSLSNSNYMNVSNLNLPANKIQNKQIYSHLACQLDNYNLLQMKYLAYNLLMFVNDLVVSEELVIKLAELYEEKSNENNKGNSFDYSNLFQNFLEKILLLILKLSQVFTPFEQHANKIKSLTSTSPSASNTQQLALINDLRKFHKAILNKSYDLMERTISLLDSKQFIVVVRRLIKHDLIQIRRRVLGLLNNKLRKYEPSEQDRTLMISLVDDLLDSIQLPSSLNQQQQQQQQVTDDAMDTATTTTTTDTAVNSEHVSQLDIEINNQTILFSIKLLCKRIGDQNPLAFTKVIKYLSENFIEKKSYIKETDNNNNGTTKSTIQNINLLSSVLLCIGELCLKLKSNCLIYLNQIVLFTLEIVDLIRSKCGYYEYLENDLTDDYLKAIGSTKSKVILVLDKNYELLTLSCVTCLLKIVQNLAGFLSPFLRRLIFISCSLSYLVKSSSDRRKTSETSSSTSATSTDLNKATSSNYPQIETRLTQLRSGLASLVPLRLLAPILNEQSVFNFSNDSTTKPKQKEESNYKITLKNVEYYMQIIKLAIRNVNQEDLISNIRILRSMFINLFELRTSFGKTNKINLNLKRKLSKSLLSTDEFITNELCKYEDHVIETFCDLTFKLSEDMFKPIFFKFYEWATVNDPPKDRLITFYRSTFKLSDKLKNLFVLFASQFLQNASSVLDQLNNSKTEEKYFAPSTSGKKERLLLFNMVDTLSNVFLNDSQKTFANKDCFKLLIQPLVDQIENEIDYDDYNKYINEHLGPCIANLASNCVQDDTLCRKFNYHILLKTKHNSVQVRLATLDVLNMFSKKIGDVYNSYLSETVPFLAELMEDPNEEVEEKVQQVTRELEDMLGESLQSHFV